ncbi:MAG: hypothetical protein IKB00_08050 [Bacteroidaceae bacterium]|nr:hypothetical protein [Bacteroidaceae bacterium]MBR6856222.1 hypothetical protein [Bacteroidaceae bacterium]
MKKKHLYMIAMSAILSVITLGSVKRALFFDTKIAYADPSITYVYGTDGSEHLALNNFYPKTNQLDNPSNWNAGAGGGYQNVQANLNMSHEALNACRIIETYCDNDRNNLCPLAMTGVAVVTPSGQVIQLWSNPF